MNSSAWSIIENSDFVFLINREVQKSTGTRFLTFKLLKGRGEESDVSYFNHPFAENHTMRLIDDECLSESVSVDSLSSDLLPDFDAIEEANRVNAQQRKEKKKDHKGEETIFSFDSFLNQ